MSALPPSTSDSTSPIEPRPGIYQHYKGREYEVLTVARHSESEEKFVVYRQLYGDRSWWIRPHTMFLETVDHHGRRTPRFRFLRPTP